MRGRGGR
jgi:hypothetical protein